MSEPREGSPCPPGASRQGSPPSIWRDGQAALSLTLRSPLAFHILCALSFLATFLFQAGTDLQSLAFLDARQTRLWHALYTLQPTLWVATTAIIWNDFRNEPSVWPETRRERMAILLSTSVAFVMIVLPFAAQFVTWPVSVPVSMVGPASTSELRTKVLILSTIGIAVATLHALSLFCVHVQLLGQWSRIPPLGEETGVGDLDENVLRYLRLRSQLRRFLLINALNIVVSILCVGMLRNLFNEALPTRPELFPAEPVVSYGVYYTGLIASGYLPIRKTLADVGQALAERLLRQSLGAGATWKERLEELQAARTHLGLQESAMQELQQGLSVLAPFLASLSSLALGTGG
jgi:hypothetical protein